MLRERKIVEEGVMEVQNSPWKGSDGTVRECNVKEKKVRGR